MPVDRDHPKVRALHKNLLRMVCKAGGWTDAFAWANLERMTAAELLCALGPNHIYFRYRPKKDKLIIISIEGEERDES